MHGIGYIFGLLLVGPLSDKFGRKLVIVCITVISGVIGLSKSMIHTYWVYMIVELIQSIVGKCCSPTFTLAMEIVTKEHRPFMLILMNFIITLGNLWMGFAAWLLPSWRVLLASIYAPLLLFILYIFWMDESLRWLLSKGKITEVKSAIRRIAKINKRTVDEEKLSKLKCEESTRNTSWLTLIRLTFSSKKLSLRFLCCVFMWFTALFNSYSLTINSVSLKGNKYLNYGLTAFSGIPASVIILYLLVNCRRKKPLMFSFLLNAICCIGHALVPTDYWLSILLYAGGKLSAIIILRITHIYTSELFPTYTRNTMEAMSAAFGRTGTILAPQTSLLMAYWPGLPSLIMGVMSLLTAAVVTLMPDTSNDVLPDNIQQAEAVGQKKNKDVS